ncbi:MULTISPECIES: Crp/Fnr family transcriptional regulator [unclassified Rhizobium]|uniref:Crp/Fnr family transcriptional regulator n=1 Tax=unclassified Rhizobium TaxID=2613769 RepID=UPI001A98952D|nr:MULTISPECIES: Crp/Fnr family transcriptional regulator [unclassified Rhizobium]MBX5160232.1 Crp/Fnr family transcriptional regulator [Rhizobium sp. NZLR8]MBX5165491.1 Crp/Fnr family transcriptional regulator [Rhizobium sp. NZLR4b]MBX5171760.1 Crp/Fnr family transcriptional regulator [Rhizobium sp. NZLR1b]MBX5192982.1 Crp/Fnr family transcriptional regulator [Rhizobium sp. NZLR3b]MBX5203761.1 Crp/Fnr family transcriptional regulator [Rhizobium sp. NZLR1]
MDGAISIRDNKTKGGASRIEEAVTSGPVGIIYGGRGDLDHEFPFCRSSVRKFRRGEVIASAGVVVDIFARVQHGMVSASTPLADGREFIVEIVPKGGLIGELAVLRKQSLSLEYRASSDCELHYFDGRLLRDLCANDPQFQVKLLSKALARVSELELRIISNAGSSLRQRLAGTLLRLSAVYKVDAQNSGDELIISQHELAATLPASREKVNQCLRRLRESKVVDGTHGKIRILNRKALEAYAEGAAHLA